MTHPERSAPDGGVPLVLIHGFAGDPEQWDPVVARLPAGARVLRIRLLGHGSQAGLDRGAVTFQGELERISEEVKEFCDSGAHICGYSLGARIALGLLVGRPHLFQRATLIGVHPGLSSGSERHERRMTDERWARLIELEGVEAFARAWQAQQLFASQARLPREVADAQLDQRLRHTAAGLARAMRLLGLADMPDYGPDLGGIHMPVTLMAGVEDSKFVEIARRMAARLPRATVSIVADAGHNVVIEQPAAVADALKEEGSA